MSEKRAPTGASQPTLETALEWFERLRKDEVPENELLAWLSWYEKSEANRQAFDDLQEFWRLSGGLAAGREGKQYVEQMQRAAWWQRWGWRVRSWGEEVFHSQASPMAPALPRSLKWSMAVAALIIAGVLWRIPQNANEATSDPAGVTASRGWVRAMTLPDDSRVELSPHTTIAVTYTEAERRLEMSAGEANFTVAPNKQRPFIVHVDTLRVRAVGTQFNIHRVGDQTIVSVIEGKINVYREDAAGQKSAGSVVQVTAGQQYKASGSADAGSLSNSESGDALMWREGRLRYVNEPLATVVADINRYVSRPIEIHDEHLKSLTYTGTVFVESIEEWLGAIPKEFPLLVVTESERTVLIANTGQYDKHPH